MQISSNNFSNPTANAMALATNSGNQAALTNTLISNGTSVDSGAVIQALLVTLLDSLQKMIQQFSVAGSQPQSTSAVSQKPLTENEQLWNENVLKKLASSPDYTQFDKQTLEDLKNHKLDEATSNQVEVALLKNQPLIQKVFKDYTAQFGYDALPGPAINENGQSAVPGYTLVNWIDNYYPNGNVQHARDYTYAKGHTGWHENSYLPATGMDYRKAVLGFIAQDSSLPENDRTQRIAQNPPGTPDKPNPGSELWGSNDWKEFFKKWPQFAFPGWETYNWAALDARVGQQIAANRQGR